MNQLPDQREMSIEYLAIQIGEGQTPLTPSSLPDRLTSTWIGSTLWDKYMELRMGIRKPHTPLSSIYLINNELEHIDPLIDPNQALRIINDSRAEHQLIGYIYPRFKEGCFDLKTWEKILSGSEAMMYHVSDYGCSVLIRTEQTNPASFLEPGKLESEYIVIYNTSDQLNKRILEGVTKRYRLSNERISGIVADVEKALFAGIPYDMYIPSIRFASLLAMKLGLGFYRSIDLTNFSRFTFYDIGGIIVQYNAALMREARM